ncbi:unnamed protein product [[Candida] boidinii]|uniref:Unnamed protein product n=1 Tax=Candida boidinii TaxID=5477 RepID=A0ACB5TLW0_CANBO|nr:unnamed protein product [[Candida] boidinii]GME91283.1 unnamed protein product [[Candida] boidinii]GMF73193.1 unnamed protein product [[Candida] boidinii]
MLKAAQGYTEQGAGERTWAGLIPAELPLVSTLLAAHTNILPKWEGGAASWAEGELAPQAIRFTAPQIQRSTLPLFHSSTAL